MNNILEKKELGEHQPEAEDQSWLIREHTLSGWVRPQAIRGWHTKRAGVFS